MVRESEQSAGSREAFDDDWERALNSDERRFYIYPSRKSGKQTDVMEWVKVQQIQDELKDAGIRSGPILEFGCGAAGVSLYLATRGYECHLCDVSMNALAVAARNRERHAPQVPIASSIVGDALQFPYKNNCFDAVMSFGLLEHFKPDPMHHLLSEAVRILRPGGLFVADIVPGPERLNVRTLGLFANYLGSLIAHVAGRRWRKIRRLYKAIFDRYFETAYNDREWAAILRQHALENVRVAVCRPFPVLALPGRAERSYAALIRRFIGFHRRFDGANNRFTRRWGWMYLATAQKRTEH